MVSTWFFDVISPFAYLALNEVEALSRETPIMFKPVLFSALLKHHGHLGPAEIPSKRIHTYRMCVYEAEKRGIAFRFPPAHPFNPLRALRLLCALDATPTMVRQVMNHIWRDGHDPNDDDSWAALCRQLGINQPALLTDSVEAKSGLRDNTDQAIAAGVFGVPTLSVGGELFWGVDAMPLARAFLADPELLHRGEMGRVTVLPNPFG